jgi:alkaline phosphatase D
MTFDSKHLRLYVDGTEVAAHALPIPGPAAEAAGLVIGGHRAGTGRNFDGLIDEVALWSRALTPAEITTLHHSGTPQALPTEVAAADSDGDTLEDWWEGIAGLDSQDAADALADTDHDSVPAWLERAAGTSPLIDDSAIYDYLRELASPGAASLPQIFRHPSLGTLSFHLKAFASGDLEDWSPLVPGPGIAGDVFSNDFLFSIPSSPQPGRFFQFEAAQP